MDYTITPAGRAALGLPVESAPVAQSAAPTAIVWRELCADQPRCPVTKSRDLAKGFCRECGTGLARLESHLLGFCQRCFGTWNNQSAITAKPAATTSPALLDTAEQVIAVTVDPMPLLTRNIAIGGTHVRITTITDYSYVVETLDAGGYGGFQHVGNYPAIAMVNNAIARLERESAPAIAVKPATYSPCALTIQWQTLPLLPAPVVKLEAPRPADVRVSYKCHDITAVYGVAGADSWTVYSDGPIVRKGVYTRFHSAESAIAAAKATIDRKSALRTFRISGKGTVGL